jgi:hypothetical protein
VHGTFNKTGLIDPQDGPRKKFDGETQKQREQRDEIAKRYGRKRRKPSVGVLMLRDLRKFFDDRYGQAMPEGDDGAHDDFLILLNYVAMLGDYRALRATKERWAPWMSEGSFDALVATVTANPLYLTADELGARIGLYDAKRTELKIRSIGAVDVPLAQRIERRKAKKLAKRKAKRAALRDLRPVPATKAKPWLAFGRSRSWWHANGKPQPLDIGQNMAPSKLASFAGCQQLSSQRSAALGGALPPVETDADRVFMWPRERENVTDDVTEALAEKKQQDNFHLNAP